MRAVNFLLNGRRADLQRLAISSDGALTASNYWSSLEYNENNAWNVNFGSGNFNNNNKNNTLIVRAVAALNEEFATSWVLAYEDCCLHKFSSEQCIYYRLIVWRDLMALAVEVKSNLYKPSTSIRFYVTKPRLREVFAANFRDRIAQHWVCIRLIPLIEERFHSQGDISFNCRKGFGVIAAVQAFAMKIEKVSMGYRRKAWIVKLDMKAFFMTIDRKILWSYLKPFIIKNYHGNDINELLWLTWTILKHEPQHDCVLRGREFINRIAKEKSLLYAALYVGSPIGNITSQILANFLLTFMDEAMLQFADEYGGEILRFMDDIMGVFPTKESATNFRKMLVKWAPEHLHQQIHPDKVYIQEAHKGVKTIGHIIKPGRIYLSNTTIGNMYNTLINTEVLCGEILNSKSPTYEQLTLLEERIGGLNSHLGFLSHTSSHNIAVKLFSTVPNFWQVCYIKAPHTVKIKTKYKLQTFLNSKENEYNAIKTRESALYVQPLSSAGSSCKYQHPREQRWGI